MPQYLFQCGLATAALIIILLVQDAVLHAAIVVAVASTVFIVFIIPNSVAATPRKVIGGHVVAVIVGSLLYAILNIPPIDAVTSDSGYIVDVIAALSVGLSIFLMVVSDTEHPPAAVTALGLTIPGWSWSAVAFFLVGALIFSLVRIALRPKLINLL
ncbi:MAG: HPP family protein [Dehalococcoidia bacterium]|nr:HPP family protein [Dehalococcoidia bacterium]